MSSSRFLHGIELIEVDEGGRSVRTVSSSIIGLVGTAPAAASAAAATLALGAGEAGLIFTAETVGLVGNSLRVELLPAAEASRPCRSSSTRPCPAPRSSASISPATCSGERISTAAEVMAAINADLVRRPCSPPA